MILASSLHLLYLLLNTYYPNYTSICPLAKIIERLFEINLLTSLQYNNISKEIGYYSGVSEQKPSYYYLQAETVMVKTVMQSGKIVILEQITLIV